MEIVAGSSEATEKRKSDPRPPRRYQMLSCPPWWCRPWGPRRRPVRRRHRRAEGREDAWSSIWPVRVNWRAPLRSGLARISYWARRVLLRRQSSPVGQRSRQQRPAELPMGTPPWCYAAKSLPSPFPHFVGAALSRRFKRRHYRCGRSGAISAATLSRATTRANSPLQPITVRLCRNWISGLPWPFHFTPTRLHRRSTARCGNWCHHVAVVRQYRFANSRSPRQPGDANRWHRKRSLAASYWTLLHPCPRKLRWGPFVGGPTSISSQEPQGVCSLIR